MSAPPSPSVLGAYHFHDRPVTSRKRPKTPHGRPLSPVADNVAEQTFNRPHPQRNASLASSAVASPADSAYSPRRSSSVVSGSFGSLPVRKSRSGSVVLASTTQSSPQKQHRLSRSISASVTPATLDTKEEEPRKPQTLQKRPTEPLPQALGQRTSKPSLRILSTPFVRTNADLRRPSEAHPALGLSMAASGTQTGFSPVATYNHILETTNKRMATLDYLRKVHEGQVYYFSTISYSSANLSSLPSLHPSKLGRRATQYLLLGSSLTPVLEFYASNPLDYLRALASLLSEYDAYTQLSTSDSGFGSLTKNRMGAMFKSGMRNVKGRRTSTADHSLADLSANGSATNLSSGLSSIADSMPMPPAHNVVNHDFQYLQLPSLPFDPDFNTSYATLSDILTEAYAGLLSLLPGPEACVPGVAEAFAKADKQMRKVMLGGIVNEFGESTRKEAKTEVGGLGKLVLAGLM